MQPSLSTAPGAGIPQGLRCRPSVDDLDDLLAGDEPQPIAAGVILRDPDGRVLLLKRGGGEENYAGHWGLPGGGIEDGESPEDAARRECEEETGHKIAGDLRQLSEVVTGSGRGKFVTFDGNAEMAFDPVFRDGEHTDFTWADPSDPPAPLHPAVAATLSRLDLAGDSALRLPLALDRDSIRKKVEDANGELWRLEIEVANISKATVNPYLGHEIPNADALGLEPDKVYQLLRHPDELRKAAPTANMLPLLRKHVPVSADDHRPYDVIGTTGSTAEFVDPYLQNGLSFWSREGIDDLESERKRELSCGYRYRAEMTPGNFGGMPFDGVMRDITFNHLVLVEDGRAGPDVVVGDSNEEITMAQTRDVARKMAALAARQVSIGALAAYLHPRLAMDASAKLATTINFAKVFDGVPVGPKFKALKPEIAKRLRAQAKGKMAKDATLDDVEKVLDMLDGHEIDGTEEGRDETVSEAEHNAMAAAAGGTSELGIPKKVGQEFMRADARDAPSEEFASFMKGKGATDEEVTKAWDMFPRPGKAATDEDPEDDSEEEKRKKEEACVAAEKKKAAEDKKAMDSAVQTALTAERKERHLIRQAEAEVRPYVGDLPVSMTFDSAEQIKRHALKMLGVDGADTMHADALSPVLAAQPKPGAARERQIPQLGMDADTTASFYKQFPGSDRISVA